MILDDRPATRLATRLAFLVAGFGVSCWAPLVPIAKHRLNVSDGTLGLLLLCIGIGSVFAMQATGPITARYGSKPVIIGGGLGLALILRERCSVLPEWWLPSSLPGRACF